MRHEIQVHLIARVVLDIFGVDFFAFFLDVYGSTGSVFLEVEITRRLLVPIACLKSAVAPMVISLKLFSQLVFVNLQIPSSLDILTFVEHGELFFVVVVISELFEILDISFVKSDKPLSMRNLDLALAVTFYVVFHEDEIFGLAPLLL